MNGLLKSRGEGRHDEPGPQVSEAELVAAAAGRSEAAVRELIRRCNPRLFRVARGIVSSDAEAEDVVQDTYLTAFTRLESFRGEASFSTWITRIAIHAALMRRRRAPPEEEYDTVNEQDMPHILPFPGRLPETVEAAFGRRQLRGLLEEAVADLPPELRLVFLLKEAEGMNLREIARVLELNPLTVKTRLFRARRRLKSWLEHRLQGGFEAIFPFDGQRCVAMADRVVKCLAEAGGSDMRD
ncbi:MAG: RNA polymerase sigma factor [Nitratireductor sp.]|nr:RNA polymerase sigma factor [Nitratireductor sp.]